MGAGVRKALSLCDGIDGSTAAPLSWSGAVLSLPCPYIG